MVWIHGGISRTMLPTFVEVKQKVKYTRMISLWPLASKNSLIAPRKPLFAVSDLTNVHGNDIGSGAMVEFIRLVI